MWILRVVAIVLVCVLAGCGTGVVSPLGDRVGGTTKKNIVNTPLQLKKGQIIVAFPERGEDAELAFSQSLADQYDVKLSKRWPLSSIGVDCAVYDVHPQSRLDSVVDEINQDASVRVAVKNHQYEVLQSEYNDPYASYQNNVEVIRAEQVHHWSTGRNVKIAVIDTGIDTAHPDLSPRILQRANFVQGGDVDFSSDQHGTAVAGIIAAVADDGVGIFGIAPNADIIASKACWYPVSGNDKAVCSTWTIARAIDHAINSGAQIINMSLGGPHDQLIEELLTTAHQRGIISVAAAGDSQNDAPMFPASMPTTIAVISNADHPGEVGSTWLESGPLITAPGKEILTTTPKESYNFLSGSSLSTAHVSGAVALMLERRPGKPGQVFKLINDNHRINAQLVDGNSQANNRGNGFGMPLDVCQMMNQLEMSEVCQ